MSDKVTVEARVDKDIADEAAPVLMTMGLTLSDALRMLLIFVAREKALPFQWPNERSPKIDKE